MPRPSQNTDRKLIEAGKAVLMEQGFSGLTLREVAQRAGVNLGMFNYHFKGKEDFIRRVAQEAYKDFFAPLSRGAGAVGDPKERLRASLVTLAEFVEGHRPTLMALLRDLTNGDKEALRFAKANFHRHALLLIGQVRECRAKKLLKPLPLPTLAVLLAANAVGPLVALAFVEKVSKHSLLAKAGAAALRGATLDKGQIELRVDMALAMLAPDAKAPRGGRS